jgi:hypothetical protein
MAQDYCMKCKSMTENKDETVKPVIQSNGDSHVDMRKSICGSCGLKKNRFVKKGKN